jgi:hypothetical protein
MGIEKKGKEKRREEKKPETNRKEILNAHDQGVDFHNADIYNKTNYSQHGLPFQEETNHVLET